MAINFQRIIGVFKIHFREVGGFTGLETLKYVSIKKLARKKKGDVKVKDKAAIVIAALMIASMAFAISTPIVSAGVTPTSVTYRGNTRVTLSITVTNDTPDNIDNVRFTIVGTPSPTFSAAIGGASAADNLKLAADNMENAAKALIKAGENLKLADDNIDKAAQALISAAAQLGVARDRIVVLGWENIPNQLDQAVTYLDTAGDDLALATENLTKIAASLESVTILLRHAGGAPDENMDEYNTNASENFDNAAAWLDNVGNALLNGSLRNAGENLRMAGSYLENAGKAGGLNDNNPALGTAIQTAGTELQKAGNNLKDAATYENAAGVNLTLVKNYLLSAGGLITLADSTDLATAGDNLENAAVLIGRAADNMSAVDDNILVGDNLSQAAVYLSDAATLLGAALGGDDMASVKTNENAAAQKMMKETLNIEDAGDKLVLAASKLSAAASTMLATANAMGPAGWTIVSDAANDVLFRASSTTHIASGGSKTFGFFWTTPNVGAIENTYTLRVYVYKPGSAIPTGTYDITLKVDGKAPAATTFTVTQVGVATSNLVGDKLDNAKATITLVTGEVASLGPIYVENSGNGVSLTTSPSVSTTDNLTFTATFTVGTWDDNSCQIRVSATDAIGNTGSLTQAFTVDTRAPVFVDNGFAGVVAGMRENVRQAGTQTLFRYVDNRTSKQIIGRAEDNKNNVDNDLWCTVYINTVLASKDNDENFFKSITLSAGLNVLTLRAVDRTGNEVTKTSDNIFIDTQVPTITLNTITRLSGPVTWTSGIRINDSTPTINLTALDPGYPTTGLGVAYENLIVTLDNDDNLNNAAPAWGATLNIENTAAWSVSTGIFENLIDNAGAGLCENTYWITVRANDNLMHTGDNENWVIAKRSFIVDLTAPTVPDPAATENPLDGTTFTSPTVQTSLSLNIRGIGAEAGATINIKIKNASLGTVVETETTTVGSDGKWNKTISLPVGGTNYQIEVTCTDVAGNEGTARLYGYVLADATTPTVEITGPTDEATYTTDQATVVVSGDVSKDTWETYNSGTMAVTATIQIGTTTPIPLTLSSSGGFLVDVNLGIGSNIIVVSARDSVGHTSSDTVTITRTALPTDVSAPSVTLVGTYPATTTAASITVTGTVTKDATETYSDITVKVQSALTSMEIQAGTNGSFSASVGLVDGPNTIIVQAIDESGNASTATTLTIEKVAPPADTSAPTVTISKVEAAGVTLTSPYSTDQATVVVTGTVTKDATETYSDITVKVQSAATSVSVQAGANGSFSASVGLAEGSNTITVQAVDKSLNASTLATATITRTATPWATYTIVIVIIVLILAAIAIFRKK
jgi:hypothetical protein